MSYRYVIQLASRIKTVSSWSCSQTVSRPLWRIPVLCVQWKPPDDGQRNCPEHVEFYSKNKFEKLVHLVGFIIRIYHDGRSPERQIIRPFILTASQIKQNRVVESSVTGLWGMQGSRCNIFGRNVAEFVCRRYRKKQNFSVRFAVCRGYLNPQWSRPRPIVQFSDSAPKSETVI